MSIRLATISDAEIIRDIYQAAITAIPQRPDINPKQRAFWLASGSQVSSWETAIGNFTFAVYVENSNVVGFTALHNDYIKYYDYIVGEKQKQYNALVLLKEYMDDLITTENLVDDQLRIAKHDQKDIIKEIANVKVELDELVR